MQTCSPPEPLCMARSSYQGTDTPWSTGSLLPLLPRSSRLASVRTSWRQERAVLRFRPGAPGSEAATPGAWPSQASKTKSEDPWSCDTSAGLR